MDFADGHGPNVTPYEMFEKGIFGGTYWRPIYSSIIGQHLRDQHLEFPFEEHNIADNLLSETVPDPKLNYFGVLAGSSLQEWESKGWIVPQDPYGWVQWYCRYYEGRRSPDDERQIKRWFNYAGPKGRWRRNIINKMRTLRESGGDWHQASPVIQQGLLQWGYIVNEDDLS
mgnify:CR=1 FL=1